MQHHLNRAMHSVAALHGLIWCKKRALNRAFDELKILANFDGCGLLPTRVRKQNQTGREFY
jgi:hypothetical protein